MRWLDSIEHNLLEYTATIPFEVRLAAKPVALGSAEDLAYDRLVARGLIGIARQENGGLTFQLTTLGKMIRSALKGSDI